MMCSGSSRRSAYCRHFAASRVVRTVWIQCTGEAAYVQRHLPTGGVEIHFPIGGHPQLVGPLTGPEIEVIPAHTTIVGVRFQPGTAPPLPTVLDDLVDQRLGLAELWGSTADRLQEAMARAETPERALAALHAYRRTLPAGCGPTVGITGLTLGGGIGLLGREHGLTCDHLVGAQVVLPNGSVVNCDHDHEPDLFWAVRGAGGGQFGVVTSLRFDTIPEPMTTRIEAHWLDIALEELVAAWQAWAPDAPDELTVNLTLESEPGAPVQATLFGAATLEEGSTRELLQEFIDRAGVTPSIELRTGVPYHHLKSTFADPRDEPGPAPRIRSEFFSHSMAHCTLALLLTQLGEPRTRCRRQLTFTAMGGAYNRGGRGRHRVRPPRRALPARADHRPAGHEVHRRALLPRARAHRGCDRARATDRRCPLNTGTAPAGSPAKLTGRTHLRRPIYPERTVVPAAGPRVRRPQVTSAPVDPAERSP